MGARGRQIGWTLVRSWFGAAARSVLSGRDVRARARAEATRRAFEELGPAFVKLGQVVSVRPDVFSPELVFEMERLLDRAPALPPRVVRDVIEAEFGRAVDDLFVDFDDDPVASASVAQVHRAILRETYRPVIGEPLPAGCALAVKVVRPGVESSVLADVEAARPLARLAERIPRIRRYGLSGFLDEFSASMLRECDLRNEAAVADRFAFDFHDDPLMVVPRVVWPLTSRSVLTTEFVDGWRLSELGDAERQGIDGRALALHGAQVFLRQVLEIGRFHADLHPANLFVTPDGRICYLDFGIVGHTEPAQREAIAQVLVATAYGDAERAIRYSAALGLVVPPGRRAAVVSRVSELMARTLGAQPRDVAGFALGFLRIMDAEKIEVPVGYGLLIKALVTVEGVARALYPDVDIVAEAGPYATRLVARRMLQPARVAERMPAVIRAAVDELTR